MGTDVDDVVRMLPDYALGVELGRGEYGVVWRARHRQLDREVAIKQLSGAVAADGDHASRFRREARLLASIDHPHVVAVYDYRESDELRLLIMELLTGGTFVDRRARDMSFETAVAATMAAACGLHHVHAEGVLHRDVKPENLMFDRRGVLKVTDFGIARGDPVQATALNLTRAGEFFGTPAYIAPEQAAPSFGGGWPAIGPAADQYSLAAVLYEALSGQLTHDATGGLVGLCTRRMGEEARPLREAAPAVPPEIEAPIMTALARDPAERYPSAEDFGVALGDAMAETQGSDWLDRSEVQIREPGRIRESVGGGPSGGVTAVSAEPGARSRNIVYAAVGALAAVGVVVGAFFFLGAGDDAAAPGAPGDVSSQPAGAVAAADLPLDIGERWSFATRGNVNASPVLAGDTVVVGSEDGTVFGLDKASGAEQWRFAAERPVQSSGAVSDGLVWFGSRDGNLYGLDSATGALQHKVSIGFEISSSPTVAGGTVFIGADGLYAFDTTTGDERWHALTDELVMSSPVVAGDVVVVGSNGGNVYGIGINDGTQRWQLETGSEVRSSPAVADGVGYVGSFDGKLYAFDVDTGEELWAEPLGSPIESSPTVVGDMVVVGTDVGRLVALDTETGTIEWSFQSPRSVKSSPVAVGDLIVVGSIDSSVYAVRRSDGSLAGRFETGGPVFSSPIVAGDLIIVGSQDDKVYALDGFESS